MLYLFQPIVSQQLIRTFTHSSWVSQVTVSNGYLYTGVQQGPFIIRRFRIEDGAMVLTFEGHFKWITSLLTDMSHLYSASSDTTARKWDTETGISLKTFTHPDWVRSLAIAGSNLVSGCEDGSIRVWHAETGTLIRSIPTGMTFIYAIAVSESSVFCGGTPSRMI